MEINPEMQKNNIEKELNIPSREEVESKIREHLTELIKEKSNLEMESEPCEERYDEKGLIILHFRVIEPGVKGYMEYAYMRKEHAKGKPNQSTYSSINIVWFDENDISYSGELIYIFED